MTLQQRRAWVFFDEWLGILACLYTHKYDPVLFPYVLAGLIVFVYLISYPWLWWWERKENRS